MVATIQPWPSVSAAGRFLQGHGPKQLYEPIPGSTSPQLSTHRYPTGRQLTSAQSPVPVSMQIVRKWKIFRKEVKAEVTNLVSSQRHTLYMYGNWTARKITVHLGKKKHGGKMLAYGERVNKWGSCDTYMLTILPGMDCALGAILTVTFDGFFNVYD